MDSLRKPQAKPSCIVVILAALGSKRAIEDDKKKEQLNGE